MLDQNTRARPPGFRREVAFAAVIACNAPPRLAILDRRNRLPAELPAVQWPRWDEFLGAVDASK
jgi:hypothetical protein